MKVDTAHLFDYTDEVCFQFMTDANAKFNAAGPFAKNMIGSTLLNELAVLVVRLGNLVGWPGLIVINAELRASDRNLDHNLSAFTARLRDTVNYGTDSALKAAANRLLAFLRLFGKIAAKPYEAEAADFTLIFDKFNGEFAADITTLGMGALKANLQAAFDNFKAALAARDALEKARPRDPDGEPDKVPKVRRAIHKAFRKIIVRVNSGAELVLSQDFDALIAELNPIITRYNRDYQPVIYDISKSQPAPIPDQPWTGEECTPVPSSVLFKKGGRQLRLRLGRHYDVSYKSNIDVGIAYCILHGKGRYKGSKSVSFTIRHGGTTAEWDAEIEEAAAAKAEEAKKKKAAAKAVKAEVVAPVAPKAEAAPVEEKKPVAKAVKAPKGDNEKATKAAKKAEE